jgi:hypothetical protein
VAEEQISNLASDALLAAQESTEAAQTEFYRNFFKLRVLFRDDLKGKRLMTPAELDSLADASFAAVEPPKSASDQEH